MENNRGPILILNAWSRGIFFKDCLIKNIYLKISNLLITIFLCLVIMLFFFSPLFFFFFLIKFFQKTINKIIFSKLKKKMNSSSCSFFFFKVSLYLFLLRLSAIYFGITFWEKKLYKIKLLSENEEIKKFHYLH